MNSAVQPVVIKDGVFQVLQSTDSLIANAARGIYSVNVTAPTDLFSIPVAAGKTYVLTANITYSCDPVLPEISFNAPIDPATNPIITSVVWDTDNQVFSTCGVNNFNGFIAFPLLTNALVQISSSFTANADGNLVVTARPSAPSTDLVVIETSNLLLFCTNP